MSDLLNEPIVSIQNISKRYYLNNSSTNSKHKSGHGAEFWALTDVSLDIQRGDTLGIIGDNGSGKSTLLKILSGIVSPTRGRIIYHGKILPIIDIGSGFHPDLTGRENVYLLGSTLLGMKYSEIDEIIDKIIEFSEIGNFIDEPVKNYSNGMFLRLATSIAFSSKIDILVLDEVFSVGDNFFMMKAYERISQLIKQSKTVIFASHNIADIMRICNKCIWIDKGKIVMANDTRTVVSAYMNNSKERAQQSLTNKFLQLNAISEGESASFNKSVYIHRVSIRNQQSEIPNTIIDYNSAIVIDILFDKKDFGTEVTFPVILTDDYNTTVLLSSSGFLPAASCNNFKGKKGRFLFSCEIHSRLLNVGIYNIVIMPVVSDSFYQYEQIHKLSFRIDTEDHAFRSVLQNHPTKIVPSFNWTLEEFNGG